MTSSETNPRREAARDSFIENRAATAVENVRDDIQTQIDRGVPISDEEQRRLINEARNRAEQAARDEFERGQVSAGRTREALMVVAPDGQTHDVRDLISGSQDVDVVRAKNFGYDPTRNVIMMPSDFAEQPAAPRRMLRELVRATSRDKQIRKEREAWQKLAELEEEQKREYGFLRSEELQDKYEKAEREAAEMKQATERAIQAEVDRQLTEIRNQHGVDLSGTETEAELKAAITRDLKAQQDELIYPFDKDGKGYFTGQKPDGIGEKIGKWYQESAPIQDIKYRTRLGKLPLNAGWVRYPMVAGAVTGYPVWKAGSYVLGGARNVIRNSLWKAERWGFRSARSAFWGAGGALGEGLGKAVSASLNILLAMGSGSTRVDWKPLEGWRKRHEKIMGEDTPEPPWVEEEKKKKNSDKEKKNKKDNKK